MSTRSGDDTATIGNIEEFRQQCLENMESDDRFEGPGRPRILRPQWLCGPDCWSAS